MKKTVFYYGFLTGCCFLNSGFSANSDRLEPDQRQAAHAIASQTAGENLYTSAAQFKRADNLREYFKVCKRAADLNQDWALNEMGVIYQFGLKDDSGRLIIIKNIDTAIEYYAQAVTQYPAFALAQENLERATEARDEAKAAALRILAALENDE